LALLRAASNSSMRMADRITRLRVCKGQRAMPVCERPPASPVDVYLLVRQVEVLARKSPRRGIKTDDLKPEPVIFTVNRR